MVTVITTKEKLSIPINNGFTDVGSTNSERHLQSIKDYQEVDLHRSPSFKPLPEDLFGTVAGQIPKSSIKGTFFVQIDAIEPFIQISNNQKEQQNNNNSILLTLTDGIINIKAVTNEHIPNLNFNTKVGSKLLLTNIIPIKDNLLQLTHDNTAFQYGSSTYPRPRPTRRGRGGGPYRSSYERRRNNRYDNNDGDSNFFKYPPPKNTLMDFMTSLKISNGNEHEKTKERSDINHSKCRPNNEQDNDNNIANKVNYALNNHHNCQDGFQPDENNEQLDPDEDSSHANYRERRNPLPPRLQRAQEQRIRRNTNQHYDESISGNTVNGVYSTHTISNQSLSSLSSSHEDQLLSIPSNSSATQKHTMTLDSFVQPTNILTAVHHSTPIHLTYFQDPMTYGLAAIPTASFHNQQPLIGPPYSNDHLTFCGPTPYTPSTYLPSNATISFNDDTKNNGNTSSENETTINIGSQKDENNDSGIKSESSATEQKQTLSSSSSSNGNNRNGQEEKHPDLNSNQRPRWKIGDVCFARWNEDGEFYYATIVDIQPPYCTVIYHDYNNYDQVRFSDLKMISRDQQYCSPIPPTSDLNFLAPNPYFTPRTNYYPTTIDGYIIMPEPPPFPFNSAGTLYMYPTPVPSLSHSEHYNINGIEQETQSNEITNSSSSSSLSNKDADDMNGVDTVPNDQSQQEVSSLDELSSKVAVPINLVTSNNLGKHSRSTESLPKCNSNEQE